MYLYVVYNRLLRDVIGVSVVLKTLWGGSGHHPVLGVVRRNSKNRSQLTLKTKRKQTKYIGEYPIFSTCLHGVTRKYLFLDTALERFRDNKCEINQPLHAERRRCTDDTTTVQHEEVSAREA